MTEKRLFVGKKKCEDRFTIITDYDGEIGVKENRSDDVLVLKHSDLNAQQFVAQLVVFLNDQNQAIVDLYDGSKYWSDFFLIEFRCHSTAHNAKYRTLHSTELLEVGNDFCHN